MSFEGFRFSKSGAQVRNTGLLWTNNFAESFVEGTLNIGIDLRLEEEGELVRGWIARRQKAIIRRSSYDLVVQVANQQGEPSKMRSVIADVAFESSEGISKGRLGSGIFQSLMFGNTPEIAPPFWWPTGSIQLDRAVNAAQFGEYAIDSSTAPNNDRFRYRISPYLLEIFRGLGWTVESRGLAIESLDERIEVIDVFYGPFS